MSRAAHEELLSALRERYRRQFIQSRVAGVEGFEPPLRGPEPRVLPLDDTPIGAELIQR